MFSSLFSVSVPTHCPSPLAELICTLNWFGVMLSLNRKLPWRLQFSHFYRHPLWAIRYWLGLSCPPCFLQYVMNVPAPQSFHFLLVPPAVMSAVLPVSWVTPKRILVFNCLPLLLSQHKKWLEWNTHAHNSEDLWLCFRHKKQWAALAYCILGCYDWPLDPSLLHDQVNRIIMSQQSHGFFLPWRCVLGKASCMSRLE